MNEKNLVLGNKLKELRKSFGMTQDDIAELLEMSRTSFSKYENGAANPPLAVMRKLSAIYNVPIEYLIHDEHNVMVFNTNKDGEEPDPNNLVKYFSELTVEERKLIMKMRLMEKVKKDKFIKMINNDEETEL